MNKFIFLLFVFILACSPEARMKRLLKKHPDLIHIKDTTIIDTFITKSFFYDTTLKARYFKDTIVINKNNIQTKVFYNYKTDSLYINNFVPPDTIIKYIKVEAKKINTQKATDGLSRAFIIVIILFLTVGAIKAFRQRKS